MKRNVIRLLSIIMLAVLLVTVFSGTTYVSASEEVGMDEITPRRIRENAKDTTGAAKTVFIVIQSVLTITQVIGVGVAVIMLIVLAIKYISAAPGDKAEIKKHMVVYVVGAIILFGATGVLELIKKVSIMFDNNVGAR